MQLSASRPSEHEVCMDYARCAARRGTCSRLQVGAVITVSGRLISSGYNGAPSKLDHCDHTCTCRFKNLGFDEDTLHPRSHDSGCPAGPCRLSVHAEANAIAFAARYGISTHKACMYVTHQPCLDCAKLIINAGIETVIFEHTYRDDAGLHLLYDAGIGHARFDE